MAEYEIKKMTGRPYLVDVPVCIFVWIRPGLQREQFEILKKARPSRIFLISDGGRNAKEWRAIRKNREMYEKETDWECTIRFSRKKISECMPMGKQRWHTSGKKQTGAFFWKMIRCHRFLFFHFVHRCLNAIRMMKESSG